MQIYWTLKDIPELTPLPEQDRAARWRKVYKSTFLHWETWAGLAVCALLTAVIAQLAGFWAGVVGAGAGGFIYAQAAIHVARRYYKNVLAG